MSIKNFAKFCAVALAICVLSPVTASGYGTKLDNGRNWFNLPGAVNGGGAQGLAVSGDGNYVYALDSGGVRVSTDAGLNWRDANNNLDLYFGLSDIATSNSGQYVVVSQNGRYIQMSNDYGNSWQIAPDVEYGAYRVAISSTGQYVAGLKIGVGVWFSSDYGVSFTIRPFPAGTSFQSDIAISADGSTIFAPDHVSRLLLIARGYSAPFQIISGVPPLAYGPVAVSGDGNTLLSAVYGGHIWISRDGGSNWSQSYVVAEVSADREYTAATISYDGKMIGLSRAGSFLMTSSDSGFNWESRPGSGRKDWSGITATQDGMIMYANNSGAQIFKSLPSFIWFDPGTVTFYLPDCGVDTSINTSVSASSVKLIVDTMTAAANNDGATYLYFTETDTALWGATYHYGTRRDVSCEFSDLQGTVTINRGRFISSSPSYSETTTNVSDFMQYVGNGKNSTINSGNYYGNSCGNLAVVHAANVTQSCSSGILADYDLLTQFGSVPWRDSTQTSGIRGQQSGNAYTVVKVKKNILRLAPTGSTWAATETFTVTSV